MLLISVVNFKLFIYKLGVDPVFFCDALFFPAFTNNSPIMVKG